MTNVLTTFKSTQRMGDEWATKYLIVGYVLLKLSEANEPSKLPKTTASSLANLTTEGLEVRMTSRVMVPVLVQQRSRRSGFCSGSSVPGKDIDQTRAKL